MKQDRRASETYVRIIDCAVRAVFEYGYAGATMTRIAAAAGVTRGAIQHYFGDRRVDLIAEASEHILEKRQAAYRATLALFDNAQGDHARTTMKAAYRDPETWFLVEVWIAARSEPDLKERLQDVLARVNDPADAEIQALVSSMKLYSLDFRTLKYLFRSLTRGMTIEFSRKPEPELFDAVIDLMFDAVEQFASSRPDDHGKTDTLTSPSRRSSQGQTRA